MQPVTLSTIDIPAPDQFEAWMGWFDGAFDVQPHVAPGPGFAAQTRNWAMGACLFSHVRAPGIRVTRGVAHVRRNPADHWMVTLGRHTITQVSINETAFSAPAGIPFVASLADGLTSDRPSDDRLQLYISRDKVAHIAPALERARGRALDTALGRLLGDYLNILERVLPEVAAEDLPGIVDSIVAMVAASLVPEHECAPAAEPQIDLVRLEQIRRLVRRFLRSRALGPQLLCKVLSISRSKLYRIMEAEGGVAHFVQRQRLLEAYAMLSDPTVDRPIADIAEELCFADTSGFSRAFRREFGTTPGDVRCVSRLAERQANVSNNACAVSNGSLLTLLRSA